MILGKHDIEWIFSGIGVTALTVSFKTYQAMKNKASKRLNGLKANTRIVIIDNALTSGPCSLLISAGWAHCQQKVDVFNFDEQELADADIIFINAKNVKIQLFKDQGLGLAAALKDRYPNKKIILYGLDQSVKIDDTRAKVMDGYLWQDSDLFEFIRYAEKFSKGKLKVR